MAQEAADIEVSKDSIKLSYRRYLSDSSAGFILLLSLIWIFFREFKDIAKALPSEVLLFAGLMLFLLATPVGMLINVLSWFTLEGRQEAIERRIVSGKFWLPEWLTPTLQYLKEEYLFEECKTLFGLNERNWRSSYEKLRTAVEVRYPGVIAATEPIRGFTIFLRNIVLLLFVVLGYRMIVYVRYGWHNLNGGILLLYLVSFLLPFLLLRLSAMTVFYYHVQVFFWAKTLGYTIQEGRVLPPSDEKRERVQPPE